MQLTQPLKLFEQASRKQLMQVKNVMVVTSLPFGVDTPGQNDDNESEGNELQSPTCFPQTETKPEGLVADGQEDLVDWKETMRSIIKLEIKGMRT